MAQKRTEYAQKALDLAGAFGAVIGHAPLDGPVIHAVDLAAPEGPSTGAGTQDVQHIRLIPEGGGAAIVAGWASRPQMRAELRSYALLQEIQRQRSGAALPLDPTAYGALLVRMESFFKSMGLDVTTAQGQGVTGAAGPGRPGWFLPALVAAAALALALVAFYALH